MSEFRTPTGQTGLDAYQYEAAQIANKQRELDTRFQRLVQTVREEQPELFAADSDYSFVGADSSREFGEYLVTNSEALSVEFEAGEDYRVLLFGKIPFTGTYIGSSWKDDKPAVRFRLPERPGYVGGVVEVCKTQIEKHDLLV